MIDFLWSLGSFLIALGLLITAHEFGHFWVARKCGVKVERFSIGFGKAIWRKRGQDGTEYIIAMIPLGGYVKMLDERVDDVPAELRAQAFNQKGVWQRIAIVSAGPIANFIFAFVALYFMYIIGVPSIKPVIDSVTPNTPAAEISINSPQLITAIDGKRVQNWEEVTYALVGNIGEPEITVKLVPLADIGLTDDSYIDRGEHYRLNIEQWQFDPEHESPVSSIGFNPFRPQITPQLSVVAEQSAAASAGLVIGDTITAINSEPYQSWEKFVELVKASPDLDLILTIRRDEQLEDYIVRPHVKVLTDGERIGVLGIAPTQAAWPEQMKLQLEYGLFESLLVAADKTWQLTSVSLQMIKKLFTGDVSVKNLSGPISIAQGAGNSAEYGLVYFLGFLALISVNLGIINLLPLPVLDGGHLLYYMIEVFTGKPVPEKVQEIGFKFGAVLLLMLMSLAIFNDFSRL